MADDKPAANLPTELISEKTFYTLGGASAAVLLTCWAISYVMADVSWMNYKSYRLIALILSEAAAIIIMYKKAKKETMRWVFAFLNGLLIFVNASGLNTMTSSHVFNPADTSTKKQGSAYWQFQHSKTSQAALITLPRMISWWPDKELVQQNEQLMKENKILDSTNIQLNNVIQSTENEKISMLMKQNDSLLLIITSLQTQIKDKQTQIDQFTASAQGSADELRRQLADCLNSIGDLKVKLNNSLTELEQCNRDKSSLTDKVDQLNRKLEKGVNGLTLTELLNRVCEKNNTVTVRPRGTRPSQDDRLRQQEFYKKVNWQSFCRELNFFSNPVE